MPGQQTDVFEEYSVIVTSVYGATDHAVEAPDGNEVFFNDQLDPTILTLLPPKPFRAITKAVLVEIDNPTPCLIVIPQSNIRVMPWTTGARILLPQPSSSASIAVAALSSYPGSVGTLNFTASIRFWQQPQDTTQSAGTGSINNIIMTLRSIYGTQVSTATDSVNQGIPPTPSTNAMFVAGGYANIAPDGNYYVPDRTPNIWLSPAPASSLAGGIWSTVLTYTAPANEYWRLLYLEASIENSGAMIPAGRLFWRVLENGVAILSNGPILRDGAGYQASTGDKWFKGGIKAQSLASTLTVQVLSDAGGAMVNGRANAGIYVGY